MTNKDMEALARFQQSVPGQAEHLLWQLQTIVDDLTSIVQTRAGAHEVRLQRDCIKDALRKLHDLYLDTQPALEAAE